MNQTFNLIFAIVLILSVNSKFMKKQQQTNQKSPLEIIDAAGEQVFNKYQKDGELDTGAFQNAFNDLAQQANIKPLSEEAAEEFVETYDLDGSLTIDLKEWKRFLHLFEVQLEWLPEVLSGKVNIRSLLNVAKNKVVYSKIIKDAFHKFDTDHSGSLDVDELLNVEKYLVSKYLKGFSLSTREQMQAGLDAHDTDGNGSISLPEFIRLWRDTRTFYVVWLIPSYGLYPSQKVSYSEVAWANLIIENVEKVGEEVFEDVVGKDGELDADAFALVFNQIADNFNLPPISPELAQEFVTQYDLDGSQTVDNDEFTRFLHLFVSTLHYLQGAVEAHLPLNVDDFANFVKSPVQFSRNLRAIFDKHAINGVLDVDALRAVDQEIGTKFFKNWPDLTRDDAEELLVAHDVDENGTISFAEYIRMMRDLSLFWIDYAHESFDFVN